MLPQKQSLNANLHALRLPGAQRGVRPLAAFVLDRRDMIAFAFDQIDLRREAQPLRSQMNRSRMNLFDQLLRFLRVRLPPLRLPIYPPMMKLPLHSIRALRPLPLHPLEIPEARTVRELVEHPHGEERWHRGGSGVDVAR